MAPNRRTILQAASALPVLAPAAAFAASGSGLDAAQFGVRPGAADDQSRALQRAIDQAAARNSPLFLAPGIYRAAGLQLPAGLTFSGVRGQTVLRLHTPGPLLEAAKADTINLSGLAFEGAALPANGRALVRLGEGTKCVIERCDFTQAGGTGLMLENIAGAVTGCSFSDTADTALFSQNARGLLITGNSIARSGNGGIRVWQTQKRDDGTIIADNRIGETAARAGGSGQNGNAINLYRSGNVIVRGNRIDGAAFTAVRGNGANNMQIVGNTCTNLGEVAIYAEFDFEGAAITGNIVDGAAVGVAVTNFNQGGRLATVQGNVLRNIDRKRPAGTDPRDSFGVGIGVEADTAVTGNTIEKAATAGIEIGERYYQRDVTATGNVIRNAPYGVTISVTRGAGSVVVAQNVLSGVSRGAVVGKDGARIATADLALTPSAAYPQITVTANQLR
ncbi:MAG: TIGR03808 family TAT-translocated repetitive protein [Pseudolabrys sp.]|nr:TIGR03808 family TAT-translocated repetitive protein [Pseudolabrys sp.]